MTPEIIARVDRWLASRKAWLLSAEYRDWLHHEWRLAVDRYNSHERGCRREAVAATLSGLLLALVREAWGDGSAHVWHEDQDERGDGGGWWCEAGDRMFHGDTELAALFSALEEAPQ